MHRAEIDLANPDAFADGAPHDWFRWLRAEAPVCFLPEAEGAGFWAITRHEDLKQVSRSPRIFSSARGGTTLQEIPEAEMPMLRAILLNMDPPQHVKFRRLVQGAFTPRRVEAMRPAVRRRARDIVDAVAEKGECELVADVAARLPLEVICDLMAVPAADRGEIFALSNRLIGFDDPDYQTSEEDAKFASAEMFTYAFHRAAKLRQSPGNDLVSQLLAARVDGEQLSDMEFASFFLLLAIAGNETTRTVTSWGVHTLIEHPDQRERVRRDPSLLSSAVEEILRYVPPVHYMRRTAMQDTELAGQRVREGDKLALWYPSANRDEAVFEDPDRFDVGRRPNPHLSFGIGEHFCLGAHLARVQLQEIFAAVLARIPEMELVSPPRRLRSNFVNGCKSMHVRFEPA